MTTTINADGSTELQAPEDQAGGLEGSETPAFSRSKTNRSAPSTAAQSQANEQVIDRLTANWENAPKIVVAFDMQDPRIPENVRKKDLKQRSGGAKGTPEGFYYKGTAYVISSKVTTPEDIARVLFHEVLGHAGLRGAFGKQLKPILQQIVTMRRAQVDAKVKEYGLRGINNLDRLTAAEEVLAEMAQDTPNIGFVTRAVAAIRTWLRENVPGMKALSLTDAEIIRSYILPARGFVERGRADARGNVPVMRYSFAQDDANEASQNMFRSPEVRNTKGQLLAPNGQVSKLTEGQWHQVRSPAFKKWFGDWQMQAVAATPLPRMASNFLQARQAAQQFQGRTLTNNATGMTAQVSRNSLDKMLSQKAVGKSASAAMQSLAVANLDSLFSQATLGWSKPDSQGDTNIAQIHRFFVPLVHTQGQSPLLAKITVKETAQASVPNRLYTVEAVDFSESKEGFSAAQWVGEMATADGVDPRTIRSAENIFSLAEGVQNFNPTVASKITDPDTGEPLVVYHGTDADFNTFKKEGVETLGFPDI